MVGRVALVTGGTRGIGGAISEALHLSGYKVAANYGGNEEKAKAFEDTTGVPTFKFDVGDFGAVQEGVAAIAERLGPVEVLVNNAGITRDGTMHKMDFEQWNAVLQTNLSSCFNCCRAVIDGMRQRNFGRIVNIGSVNGQAGQYGQANYAAAKSGIHGFTKALALEGASKGITVNAICPGPFLTPMNVPIADTEEGKKFIVGATALKRWGELKEIQGAAIYFASDASSYTTGSLLVVDGGWTAS